jgi:hypothetical protein
VNEISKNEGKKNDSFTIIAFGFWFGLVWFGYLKLNFNSRTLFRAYSKEGCNHNLGLMD